MIKRLAVLLLLTLVLAPGGGGAAAVRPGAVVERMSAALLETMQAAEEHGLDYRGRYQRLEPVLKASFDFPFMTRLAIGSSWRKLSPDEQARLTALFTEIANFAARFDGDDGARFETLGEEPGPRGSVLVKSRLVRPGEEAVGLDYLLHEDEQGFQIIDVFLDSRFSELARQKAEFAAVLRDGAAAALIDRLERKIAELEG
jgi:phospholipid transport system substrate-binding protein